MTNILGSVDVVLLDSLMPQVSGWAFSPDDPIRSIRLVTDSGTVSATTGIERPDVLAAHPQHGIQALKSGYEVDWAGVLSVGGANARLEAVTTAGVVSGLWSGSFSTPAGAVNWEAPLTGAAVGAELPIGGWIVHRSEDAITLQVSLDGKVLGAAEYLGPRSDVANILAAGGGWVASAWELKASITEFGLGEHEVELAAQFGEAPPLRDRRPFHIVDWLAGAATQPIASQRVPRGRTLLGGWVNTMQVATVAVDVDGVERAMLELDSTRERAEWSALVDFSDAGDNAEVSVRVLHGTDWRTVSRTTVQVVEAGSAHGIRGALEVHEAGPSGALPITGWAVSHTGEVSSVELFANGKSHGLMRMGVIRGDVVKQLPIPTAEISGFEKVIDIGDERGPIELEARVTLTSGLSGALPPLMLDGGLEQSEDEMSSEVVAPFPRVSADRDGPSVVVVTHDLGIGGGQLYLQTLMEGLVRTHNARLHVVSQADGVLREALEDAGVPVMILAPAVDNLATHESNTLAISHFIEHAAADAVICNTLGTFAGVNAAEKVGVPALWAIHESFPPRVFARIAFGPEVAAGVIERFYAAFESAYQGIFEAESTRQIFESYFRPSRTRVVRYGIDFEAIDEFISTHTREQVRSELGFGPDDLVMTLIGTFEPRKAQTRVLQAFATIAAQAPNARLVLVGDRPGRYSDVIHEFIKIRGLGDRVRTVPVTSAIGAWYFASDILLSASDVESLPRSMIEAMAYESVIAATAAFGVAELVEDGVTGLLTAPNDLNALSDLLRRAVSMTPAERDTMATAGRHHVEQHYRAEGYVDDFAELIRQASADAASHPSLPTRAER